MACCRACGLAGPASWNTFPPCTPLANADITSMPLLSSYQLTGPSTGINAKLESASLFPLEIKGHLSRPLGHLVQAGIHSTYDHASPTKVPSLQLVSKYMHIGCLIARPLLVASRCLSREHEAMELRGWLGEPPHARPWHTHPNNCPSHHANFPGNWTGT